MAQNKRFPHEKLGSKESVEQLDDISLNDVLLLLFYKVDCLEKDVESLKKLKEEHTK